MLTTDQPVHNVEIFSQHKPTRARTMVFVINLDRRTDRWQAISDELSAHGIAFERIAAVDARDWSAKDIRRPFLSLVYNGFTAVPPAVFACFQSHRRAWERIATSPGAQAIVLEDDARLCNFDERLFEVDLEANGIDILRLGISKLNKKLRKGRLVSTGCQLAGREVLRGRAEGAFAYMISAAGARKCLAVWPAWFPVDHFHIWERVYGVRTACLLPVVWAHGDMGSDILPDEASSAWVLSRTTATARSLMRRMARRLVLTALCRGGEAAVSASRGRGVSQLQRWLAAPRPPERQGRQADGG